MPRRSATEVAGSRAQTLAAAVQLASVVGLEGLTIGRLADQLGMSKSGLVGRFGSKEQLQLAALDQAAATLQATPMQVALAWLLQRSPNILVIPGTSSVAHLRENLRAATLQLPSEVIAALDRPAAAAGPFRSPRHA